MKLTPAQNQEIRNVAKAIYANGNGADQVPGDEAAETWVKRQSIAKLLAWNGDAIRQRLSFDVEIGETFGGLDYSQDVEAYNFDPPLLHWQSEKPISQVGVTRYDGATYDLFDQDGECLNEGHPLHTYPTREFVTKFVTIPLST